MPHVTTVTCHAKCSSKVTSCFVAMKKKVMPCFHAMPCLDALLHFPDIYMHVAHMPCTAARLTRLCSHMACRLPCHFMPMKVFSCCYGCHARVFAMHGTIERVVVVATLMQGYVTQQRRSTCRSALPSKTDSYNIHTCPCDDYTYDRMVEAFCATPGI